MPVPKRIGEVAKDFPKLPIIMGHSGLVEGVREVVEIAKRCENVHMDSSGVGWLPFFCESISWAGPDRVLYGSDHPFNPMDWEIEKIVKTRAATSQAQDRRSPIDYGGQYQAAAQDELGFESRSIIRRFSQTGGCLTCRRPRRVRTANIERGGCAHDGAAGTKKSSDKRSEWVVEGCKKRGISVTELRSGSRRGVTAQVRAEIARKLVEDYGLTLAEVARQVGISTSGVSKLLSRSLST